MYHVIFPTQLIAPQTNFQCSSYAQNKVTNTENPKAKQLDNVSFTPQNCLFDLLMINLLLNPIYSSYIYFNLFLNTCYHSQTSYIIKLASNSLINLIITYQSYDYIN